MRGKPVPKKAQPVTVPAMLNGCIAQPGHVDRWEFTAHKGDKLSLELRAAQLGSPLAGVLTISDAQGKQLGRAEGRRRRLIPCSALSLPRMERTRFKSPIASGRGVVLRLPIGCGWRLPLSKISACVLPRTPSRCRAAARVVCASRPSGRTYSPAPSPWRSMASLPESR